MSAPVPPTDDREPSESAQPVVAINDTTTPTPQTSGDAARAKNETPPSSDSFIGRRVVGLAAALGGMVVGAVVGVFVEGAMESTGWFGPTIETVIEEQLTNFNAIQEKLGALETATTEADRTRITAELVALLDEQERLAERTHIELSSLQQQLEAVRTQNLREGGVAGGVDFWLTPGESVSVGSRNNVFALYRIHSSFISVIMSGESHRMSPGDFLDAPVGDAIYKVFYRIAPTPANQNRAGFDIVLPEQ